MHNGSNTVKIGIVGKYFDTGDFVLSDAYLSVIEAIKHASWFLNRRPEITWLNAELYEKEPAKLEELKKFEDEVKKLEHMENIYIQKLQKTIDWEHH